MIFVTLWLGWCLAHKWTIFIWGGAAAAVVIGTAVAIHYADKPEDESGATVTWWMHPHPGITTAVLRVRLAVLHAFITTLPNRGDAQGRDVRVCASDSRPAPGADLTGSLSPRSPIEGPGPVSAPPARPNPDVTSPAVEEVVVANPPAGLVAPTSGTASPSAAPETVPGRENVGPWAARTPAGDLDGYLAGLDDYRHTDETDSFAAIAAGWD